MVIGFKRKWSKMESLRCKEGRSSSNMWEIWTNIGYKWHFSWGIVVGNRVENALRTCKGGGNGIDERDSKS